MTVIEELRSKLKQLSVNELLSLQSEIITELHQKTAVTPATPAQTAKPLTLLDLIPGAYRPTKAQIEAHLAAVFTKEELAEADKVDLNNLPIPPKPVSAMIIEDREDRI
jgi:hypothetical protein